MDSYDLSVIGAGWSGVNAAIRASELNLKTLLIDKDLLGGTCLNYGCIPAKSLIQSVKIYKSAKTAENFGIKLGSDIRIDFAKMQSMYTWKGQIAT